jgi:hypothetical protein
MAKKVRPLIEVTSKSDKTKVTVLNHETSVPLKRARVGVCSKCNEKKKLVTKVTNHTKNTTHTLCADCERKTLMNVFTKGLN